MGFGWGIFGASFATVLAQLIAFLLCLRSLRRLPFVQLTKADWKTDPAILLHLCRLGIPTGLQMSMITLGGMVLQSVLNGFGVVFVAGYTAENKLYGILECIGGVWLCHDQPTWGRTAVHERGTH